MTMFDWKIKAPKHNIKKLGKIFDLDTLNTDTYLVILLASTSTLTMEAMDKFDETLEAYESDPELYTRTPVPLQLNETPTGYQINIAGNSVVIPLEEATVEGVLIVKEDTMDILAAALNLSGITINQDLTITQTKPVWNMNHVDSS